MSTTVQDLADLSRHSFVIKRLLKKVYPFVKNAPVSNRVGGVA